MTRAFSRVAVFGGVAAFLSACFAQSDGGADAGHVETTLLGGAVTVCMDAALTASSRGMTDWSRAQSPDLDDFRAVVAPRGGSIVESSKGEFGKLPERANIPFCADSIPRDAVAYAVSGKPGDQMTESERTAYDAWRASRENTPHSFASDTLYVVDGRVVHINIVRVER